MISDQDLEARLARLEKGLKTEGWWRWGWSGALTAVVYFLVLSQMNSCATVKELKRSAEIDKRAAEQAKQDRLELQLEQTLRRIDGLENRLPARP